ncbi:uncharacterized protein METZ01_LOCUS197398, partial [marine metagenome]
MIRAKLGDFGVSNVQCSAHIEGSAST